MKKYWIFLSFLIILGIHIEQNAWAQDSKNHSLAANVAPTTGALSVPNDYTQWTTLGTWAHAKTEGKPGSKEYHVVYTQPETIKYYKKFGRFPDGAVLVKELLDTKTLPMTTGPVVSHATTITGWFVMVRDMQNRFPDSPLWGDGWGWSFFKADNPLKTVSNNYKEDCLACHLPAREMAPPGAVDADKWIYTFGYPVLNKN